MNWLYQAIGLNLVNGSPFFSGRAGHIKFAHQAGYAMPTFDDKERQRFFQLSYEVVYVPSCLLAPLLEADEWIKYVKEGEEMFRASI